MATTNDHLVWRDATGPGFTVRGLWWFRENGRQLCRLPRRAEKLVREPVWQLAQNTAGVRVCFRSNATRLRVRAELSGVTPFPHMPASGHSGVALYGGAPGRQTPWGWAFPALNETRFEGDLFAGVTPQWREFTLYLPLYNGIRRLELGLTPRARLARPTPPRLAKPVVFYGTSITQGGCANTPDGDYVNTVSRQLDVDVINLGFSGNGQGEPELARLLGEIDAGAFVLDYVANVDARRLRATLPTFVRLLRSRHPTTPIVLLSRVVFASTAFSAPARQGHDELRDILIQFYARQRQRGERHLHFVDGNALIPYGSALAYSDGVHPTSAGFGLMAALVTPQLAAVLFPDA